MLLEILYRQVALFADACAWVLQGLAVHARVRSVFPRQLSDLDLYPDIKIILLEKKCQNYTAGKRSSQKQPSNGSRCGYFNSAHNRSISSELLVVRENLIIRVFRRKRKRAISV